MIDDRLLERDQSYGWGENITGSGDSEGHGYGYGKAHGRGFGDGKGIGRSMVMGSVQYQSYVADFSSFKFEDPKTFGNP